jgi:hypothetical protein
MSSKEPTFGGAVGEAGAPALDALRSSRESYEGDRLGLLSMLEQHRAGQAQLALQQQAAAARAAGGGGGAKPVPAAVLTALNAKLSGLRDELPSAMSNPARRDEIEKEIRRLNAISDQVLSSYNLGASFGEDGYDFMTQ